MNAGTERVSTSGAMRGDGSMERSAIAQRRPQPPSPLMRPEQVAEWLHTSRAAIYKMVERGQLPGVRRIGRRLYFHRETLVHWLNQNRALSPKGVW